MPITKRERYKKGYTYSFADTLDKEVKEESRAVNVLAKLEKRSNLTEREKGILNKAINLVKDISSSKKELSFEKKNIKEIEKKKFDNTVLLVKQKMIKKKLTIREKLDLYAKTVKHYSYSGLIDFQSLQRHYNDNVIPTIANKMIDKDISFEEAFSELNKSHYDTYKKNEVEKALIEFKDEIDAIKD